MSSDPFLRVAPVAPTGAGAARRTPSFARRSASQASFSVGLNGRGLVGAERVSRLPIDFVDAGWDNRRHLRSRRVFADVRRPGMTLIEVLLALAILAVVMGAVAQLVHIGTRAAQAAEETALAQLVAESKMNELASGAAPMSASGLTDYEGREGWQYSVEITPVPEPAGLVSVKVFVQQVVATGDGVTYELYRWMPAEGFLDMALVDDSAATESGTTESGLSLPGSSPAGDSGDSP